MVTASTSREQRVDIVVEAGAAGLGHLAATGGVGVVHPDQARAFCGGEVPGVMPPQRADADDADRQCRHQTGTPRWELETKSRNRSTSGSGGSSVRARSMAWERLSSELKKSR